MRISANSVPMPWSMRSIIAAYTAIRRSHSCALKVLPFRSGQRSICSQGGHSGSRGDSARCCGNSPNSFWRCSRRSRITSQPTVYEPRYLAMSSGQACSGQCGCGVGQVQEVGTFGIGLGHELGGAPGEVVGRVVVRRQLGYRRGAGEQLRGGIGRPVVARPAEDAVVAVEAAVRGPVGTERADVPLAGHEGLVTVGLERLGQGRRVVAQVALVGTAGDRLVELEVGMALGSHVADAGAVGIQTGQQRRPRRAAAGTVVELGVADARFGEGVDMRGVDLPAVAAQIGITHVIHQDDDHVGSGVTHS